MLRPLGFAWRGQYPSTGGAWCPAERPIDGLALTNITGTCGRGIALANAIKVELAGIAVTGFSGLQLTTDNGTRLDNPATPAPAAH